jgi:putative DNA primase/helicase
MDFQQFAQSHGLIVRDIIPNRWVVTPTIDHPRSGNGRYKFLGDVGWVQNWATMQSPATWRPDGNSPQPVRRYDQSSAIRERQELADKASRKAGWIMHQTKLGTHRYLEDKGFVKEEGNIWEDGLDKYLVIPMRISGKLVGCQLIDNKGKKKFLYGQTSKGAEFTIDAKGFPIFCEGYATGLSIREAMIANKMLYTIHICFSANNMKLIASKSPKGLIVADNDSSGVGESIAKETGKPYWISDTVGEDFNDYHRRTGIFKSALALKKLLLKV